MSRIRQSTIKFDRNKRRKVVSPSILLAFASWKPLNIILFENVDSWVRFTVDLVEIFHQTRIQDYFGDRSVAAIVSSVFTWIFALKVGDSQNKFCTKFQRHVDVRSLITHAHVSRWSFQKIVEKRTLIDQSKLLGQLRWYCRSRLYLVAAMKWLTRLALNSIGIANGKTSIK